MVRSGRRASPPFAARPQAVPGPGAGGAPAGRREAARRLVLGVAGLAAGCAAPEQPDAAIAAALPPGRVPVRIVPLGWHTEIQLPVLPEEPLGRLLAPWFPAGGRLGFGFGERAYFTNPAPQFADMLRAARPGEAALVVDAGEAAGHAGRQAVTLPLPEAMRAALAETLAGEFEREAAGSGGARRIDATLLRPEGHFFAARRPYSLSYTCNTWTLQMLAEAGLPVRWQGVILASGAMAEARRARERLADSTARS